MNDVLGLFIWGALLLNAGLGASVYLGNRHRLVNKFYLLLSMIIALWLYTSLHILHADSAGWAILMIQSASAIAATIPTCCHLLRIAIEHPKRSPTWVIGHAWPALLFNAVIAATCFTPFFLQSVRMSDPDTAYQSVVEPEYGPGFVVFTAYMLAMALTLIISFHRARRRLRGARQTELNFLILGSSLALFMGILFGPVFTLIMHTSRFYPISNAFSISALTIIVSYGVATRRIMQVTEVLKRATAAVLLAVFLSALYAVTWYAAEIVVDRIIPGTAWLAYLLASLTVAFSVVPARGKMQQLTQHMFGGTSILNVRDVLRRAGDILQSITTLDELLRHFHALITTSVEADRAFILIKQDTNYRQVFPVVQGGDEAVEIPETHDLCEMLAASKTPLVEDLMDRQRPTEGRLRSRALMWKHGAHVAIGIFSKRELTGIVLLGARRAGRLYDQISQDTLQLLCNQLSVSLDNSRLYTRVEDNRRYLENLLENLVSGVIAVDADGIVDVCNPEGQRMIGMPAAQVIGKPLKVLPRAMRRLLEEVLRSHAAQRDVELQVENALGQSIPVQAGTSAIFIQDEVKGALIVFNDLTRLKQLELVMRRHDRLDSVGTLAAGMAHEIKNPLVTIKTYGQLLPERFDDPEFREHCSTLINQEANRIDTIVNKMMNFARPVLPSLGPMELHRVLDRTLQLVDEQLKKNGITLYKGYRAEGSMIMGDASQLEQVFVNLYLNAAEAMHGMPERSLSIITETIAAPPRAETAQAGATATPPAVRVTVRDSGSGIHPEHLSQIFDPFFTTRDRGSGMGLAVVHGILGEHGAIMEVFSEPDKGAAFQITFPCLEEESLS